ncbi:hypothetical protein GW813_09540 [bacterium]|nr:hypothetical protein [bacterium]
MIAAAKAILEEIQPASIRAVCYRLFVAGLIPTMAKNNTNAVGRLLVGAREDGVIPWAWVVDETREAERISAWNNPEEIIRATIQGYRKDYWTAQPERVEVWSEKGTVRGTLAPVLNEYGVTFRVMHGYGSATSLHDIAEVTAENDKPLTVLYVGDWDPSGLHMSEIDLPRRLERYGGSLNIIRVALNAGDVAAGTDLPSFEVETKSKDPRYKWFVDRYGNHCWELDALSPVILRQRVDDEIFDLLDVDTWNRAIEVEAAERESMQSILGTWKSISMQASKYSDGAA